MRCSFALQIATVFLQRSANTLHDIIALSLHICMAHLGEHVKGGLVSNAVLLGVSHRLPPPLCKLNRARVGTQVDQSRVEVAVQQRVAVVTGDVDTAQREITEGMNEVSSLYLSIDRSLSPSLSVYIHLCTCM